MAPSVADTLNDPVHQLTGGGVTTTSKENNIDLLLNKRKIFKNILLTRMHSSRMRTARSSSRLLGGIVCLIACRDTHPPQVWAWRTPQVWAWRTPQVWAWRPPQGVGLEIPPGCGPGDPPHPLARPLNLPRGCGLETCKACWDTTPPVDRILDTRF